MGNFIGRFRVGSLLLTIPRRPWDLRDFLHYECGRKEIAKEKYFDQWVNVRWLFADFYHTKRMGVRKMLARQNSTFLGARGVPLSNQDSHSS